ncbi:MAG: Mu-like prophage major head subunit gpT family protein [Armatimonadota bacterium]|nr:Mu-like prophage major head subunit gpT family protein [Armatimonadota bacterium]
MPPVAPGAAAGPRVRVRIIKAGLARSGRFYPARALDDLYRHMARAPVRCYADHPTALEDAVRPVRSVRDLAGYFTEPARAGDGLYAVLNLLPAAAWAHDLVREALRARARGLPGPLVGLSIDALARVRPVTLDGRPAAYVEEITALKSVDLVTEPSAGGEIMQEILESVLAPAPTAAALPAGPPEPGAAGEPAGQSPPPLSPAAPAPAAPAPPAAPPDPAHAIRVLEAQLELERALARQQPPLPPLLAGHLRSRFAGQAPAPHEIQEAIHEELVAFDLLRRQLGAPDPPSPVTGHGTPRHALAVLADGRTRGLAAVQAAMDRLFGLPVAEADQRALAGHRIPDWSGLREAYVAITGDPLVSGRIDPERSIIREANEVTTAVMASVVLNSMTKRLVRDYQGQPQDWRRFCSVRAIKDFKTQDRIRLFDFSSLSTVAENAAYTSLPWDDAREVYTPAKRGNLVVVTREMILNDDLDAVRKIPQKLAVAAGVTINEFVAGLFTANAGAGPALSDGFNVFDNTNHANAGTSALSSASLQAALVAMLKQTSAAGKRLGLRPRFLLVPPDLLFTALVLVQSPLVPGSNNNDVNVLRGALEVLSIAAFTDTNNWYLLTDPAQVETIEIGFVGGQETPQLFVQDGPTEGAVFTNDAITYKIRWEFGGGWVDYRGAYGSLVVG